ncbi:IclR family transcriptional regulator domain-containing protein [Paraburkholderia sediminicola]
MIANDTELSDVVSIVTPHLERLYRKAEETVALGRISGCELAFVHAIVAEQELRSTARVVDTNVLMTVLTYVDCGIRGGRIAAASGCHYRFF